MRALQSSVPHLRAPRLSSRWWASTARRRRAGRTKPHRRRANQRRASSVSGPGPHPRRQTGSAARCSCLEPFGRRTRAMRMEAMDGVGPSSASVAQPPLSNLPRLPLQRGSATRTRDCRSPAFAGLKTAAWRVCATADVNCRRASSAWSTHEYTRCYALHRMARSARLPQRGCMILPLDVNREMKRLRWHGAIGSGCSLLRAPRPLF